MDTHEENQNSQTAEKIPTPQSEAETTSEQVKHKNDPEPPVTQRPSNPAE